MPTILERCYEYHTISAKEFTEAVVFELAAKLNVAIIYIPEEPPRENAEMFDYPNIYVRAYAVVDNDLTLVVGYDGFDHITCGRLHTPAYLKHANGLIKNYVDSPYYCPERYCQRVGETLGVFAEPRSNWLYDPFFNQ